MVAIWICSSLPATADVVGAGFTALERPNGLFREVREHRRTTLAALHKQLGLVESDVDGAPVVPLHISAARRAAVKVRWDRVRAERGER